MKYVIKECHASEFNEEVGENFVTRRKRGEDGNVSRERARGFS